MASMNAMVLLAKLETTYGTDVNPTGAADAMLLSTVDITPLDADEVERTFVRPYFGASAVALAAKRTTITGSVELAGAGAAGTVPAYAPLLRSAGLAQLVTTGAKVEFKPVSRDFESATLWHYIDGTLHKGLGARGDFSLSIAVRQIPRITFTHTGLYVPAAAGALPTAVFTAWKDPDVVGYSDTPSALIDGYPCKMQSFQYRHANQVAFRELVGQQGVRISGRQPRATMVIEAPDALQKDFFALSVSRARVPVAITHGQTAGKIVEVGLGQAQVRVTGGYTNDDGIAMMTLELRPLPNLGDDEFLLRVR